MRKDCQGENGEEHGEEAEKHFFFFFFGGGGVGVLFCDCETQTNQLGRSEEATLLFSMIWNQPYKHLSWYALQLMRLKVE